MVRELDSRGRKNPQAFSYDGVLSQGNGVATIVEDASQHADLLRRLLNVPDENRVKLDKGIGMDVDTQLIMLSNPDLDAELDRHAAKEGADPLKALKRRLTRHEFRYLTDRGLEAALLRREIAGQTRASDVEIGSSSTGSAGEDIGGSERTQDGIGTVSDHVRRAVRTTVRDDDGQTRKRELAPHAIGAAALYAVITRLEADDLPDDIGLVEKARLFETGELRREEEVITIDDVSFGDSDGQTGIPVTYTRDVIADLLSEESDRGHPEIPVARVVMPHDVLDAMVDGLVDAPVFSDGERKTFESRHASVAERVRERQRTDVVDAALAAESVSAETIAEYVEHVYAWDAGEPIETERGPESPDSLVMKVFETETLGRFGDGDYRGTEPSDRVKKFRREQVIHALTRHAWRNRGDEFNVDNIDLSAIPELRSVLESNSLVDLKNRFPELDPGEWDDPPADTETARLKTKTVDRMTEQGYSLAAAELTSRAVMRDIREEWEKLPTHDGQPPNEQGDDGGAAEPPDGGDR
jgi:non-specific serine/threonine protein kinase